MSAGPPLAGVVGWPIGHSRSPRLHGHWLARYGIAGHYVPLAVAPDDLAAALTLLPRLGFRGVNVTLPHKERTLALAADRTEAADRIGAANTLTFLGEGGFRADNTDATGFLASLRQEAPGWSAAGGPALVLGAGGAARAVVHALAGAGAPRVLVANRGRERAEALAAGVAAARALAWDDAEAACAGAATIVNATSLGMTGQPPLEVGLGRAPAGAVVCDLVYQPLETAFLARARGFGLAAVGGLGMLLHQAAPGFEAWFGRRPEVDAALREAVLGAAPGPRAPA